MFQNYAAVAAAAAAAKKVKSQKQEWEENESEKTPAADCGEHLNKYFALLSQSNSM